MAEGTGPGVAVEQERLQESVGRLLGPDRIATATPADAIDGVQPSIVVEPRSVDEAARVMAWANEAGAKLAPRGSGSKMGWGNVPRGIDVVLSTLQLDQLVEHAAGDMTATVQAGLELGQLQQALGREGQMLALDPPFSNRATIGGLVATNDSGPLRLRYGGIRDQVLGVTLVRADGVVTRAGGKVVKNVAGYDLSKLVTGSLGTLGLIVQATFRLYPRPDESQTLLVRASSVEQASALMLELLDAPLVPTGLTLRWRGEAGCELFLRLSGVAASVAAQSDRAHEIIRTHQLESSTLTGAQADAAWQDLIESPWSASENALVARLSVLPTEAAPALLGLQEIAQQTGLRANAVINAHGLGVVRLEDSQSAENGMLTAAEELRQSVSKRHGTLVMLSLPLSVKPRLDVWGPAPDALPLMRRVKTQLDPKRVLNPGRFVGGI
jgi:glycolate oxidase FAD binding subunit